MATLFWTLLGAFLSILFYPVIIPFIENPIQTFLLKVFGKSAGFIYKKKNRLTGEWIQVWHVKESNYFPSDNESKVTLSQFGKKVHGKVDNGKNAYTIIGTIDKEMYLTGIWEDAQEGNIYKGAFQLYIHKYASHMTGKWVGYSEKNIINTGDWYWRRIEKNEYKK